MIGRGPLRGPRVQVLRVVVRREKRAQRQGSRKGCFRRHCEGGRGGQVVYLRGERVNIQSKKLREEKGARGIGEEWACPS